MHEVSPFLSLSFYFSMRIPKEKRRRNKCRAILCKSCRLKIGFNVNGKHVMMSCKFYAFTLRLGYNKTSILGGKKKRRPN